MDFCVGPHVPSSGRLKAFKLLTTSNAYWKGDARNQPMQRVYGTAFFSEKELQEHLKRLEEAKARDHRKIGKDQKLFMFHAWAPGATFWLPKGTVLYNTLADYMRERAGAGRLHRGEGADRLQQGAVGDVRPLVSTTARTCSWWSLEGEQMGLKAMNCPGHMLMFAQRDPQLQGPARSATTSRRRCTGTRRRACCRA